MNLYLISQRENSGYDTYDSAVVAANTEDEARNIHPSSYSDSIFVDWTDAADGVFGTWARHRECVEVELIGVADARFTAPEVIVASFNAG